MLDVRKKDKETLWFNSVFSKDFSSLEKMIDKGYDINSQLTSIPFSKYKHNLGNSALGIFTGTDNFDGVAFCLENHADIEHVNYIGLTPLYVAIQHNMPEMAAYLISEGANVDVTDDNEISITEYCVNEHYTDCLKSLLENGANPNKITKHNSTLLIQAVTNDDMDIFTLLLENGADINQTEIGEVSVLMTICHSQDEKNADFLDICLSKNVDINAQDNEGWTALHSCIISNNIEYLQKLIDNGADLSIKTMLDESYIEFAKENGNQTIANFLEKLELEKITSNHKLSSKRQNRL